MVHVKERPVPFNGEMVRAVLEGRKTQTRRVFKSQPPEGWFPKDVGFYHPTEYDKDGEEYPGEEIFGAADEDWGIHFPYGQPGDRLWVREAWRTEKSWDGCPPRNVSSRSGISFIADEVEYPPGFGRYRHARFMPRWVSRLTLEITEVRVERVQDISEHDARNEGVRGNAGGAWGCEGLLQDFEELWDSIHHKDGLHWDANPYVWVIGFKRVDL